MRRTFFSPTARRSIQRCYATPHVVVANVLAIDWELVARGDRTKCSLQSSLSGQSDIGPAELVNRAPRSLLALRFKTAAEYYAFGYLLSRFLRKIRTTRIEMFSVHCISSSPWVH